jgi:hypothetical protein
MALSWEMTGSGSLAMALRDRLGRLVCAVGLLALAGCGGPKLVSVSGKVTVGGQPLTTGQVLFSPDPSKGNNARVACVGRLDDQGRFELSTAGVTGSERGKGAPLGWYKVTIRKQLNSTEMSPRINPDCFDESKTPLSVQVVASPQAGAYDFEVGR